MSTKTTGKLKIFSGSGHLHGQTGQKQFIVAATSRSKAVEALHAHGVFETANRLSTHWFSVQYEAGMPNDVHYAPAAAQPGQVFVSPFGFSPNKKYDPLPKISLDRKEEEQEPDAADRKSTASPGF